RWSECAAAASSSVVVVHDARHSPAHSQCGASLSHKEAQKSTSLMKTFLSLILLICVCTHAQAQTTAPVIWQVTLFDLGANVQQTERTLNVVATINATNVGGSPGRTLTVRLNSKASVKSVAVAGAAANFRPGTETRGDLQRLEISLPALVSPGA